MTCALLPCQRRERQQDPYQPICQEPERMVAELAASSLSRLQSVYQAYTCIDSLHLRVAWKLTCMLGQACQRESNLNARIRDMQVRAGIAVTSILTSTFQAFACGKDVACAGEDGGDRG